MKKILTLLLCISSFGFMANAQTQPEDVNQSTPDTSAPASMEDWASLYTPLNITVADVQGFWTLTALEGQDTAVVLTPEEIQARTDNYLHDMPLTLTTLNLSGSDFTMTHHGSASTTGVFDLVDPLLFLHAVECAECDEKTFTLIIRSWSASELVIDMFDEDQGSSSYVHLTFTK